MISIYQEGYISFLKAIWGEKRKNNPAFSLRSFARFLNSSPSVLSLILNGKRPLSQDKAINFSIKLKLNNQEHMQFMDLVSKDMYYRLNSTEKNERKINKEQSYTQIQLDQFKLISDWFHFGIMNLTLLDSFKSDANWIAQTLKIDKSKCIEAISRLEKLGLLICEKGQITRTNIGIETPTDLPSSAIKSFHLQNIDRAKVSLLETDIQDRDITSIMMPISKDRLLEAKKMIKNFRKELSFFLKSGESSDEVYSLNIQLFPQTQVNEK